MARYELNAIDLTIKAEISKGMHRLGENFYSTSHPSQPSPEGVLLGVSAHETFCDP